MASADMTLHIELMGQDRDLLERLSENIEWYRKHLQEQAQMMQVEQEAQQKEMKGHLLDTMGREQYEVSPLTGEVQRTRE